jgi:hypothetical protein
LLRPHAGRKAEKRSVFRHRSHPARERRRGSTASLSWQHQCVSGRRCAFPPYTTDSEKCSGRRKSLAIGILFSSLLSSQSARAA